MDKSNMTHNDSSPKAKRLTHTLKTAFFLIVALALLCVAYNEIMPGTLLGLIDCGTKEYYILMAMELVTVCTIPVALKIMKLRRVRENIRENGLPSYLRFALLRMSLIGFPMLANIFFYYCFMSVSYAYMAIIEALCLAFVYPGEGRCLNEIQCEE